jgi:hypothetical protein
MPHDVETILLRIATTLERIETRVFSDTRSRSRAGQSLLSRAIAIALDEGITTKAEIARRLGVHRSNLTRMPKLDLVLENIRRHHILK